MEVQSADEMTQPRVWRSGSKLPYPRADLLAGPMAGPMADPRAKIPVGWLADSTTAHMAGR